MSPSVGFDDLVVDAVARDATPCGLAPLCTDALAVVDELPGGLRRQRLQAPHVRVVVERVPGAVEKDRKAFHDIIFSRVSGRSHLRTIEATGRLKLRCSAQMRRLYA